MDSNRWNDIIAPIIRQAISDGVFSGCVVGLAQADGSSCSFPFGYDDSLAQPGAIQANSIFDIASVTKSVATGSLALLRILQGKLDPDCPVQKILPEYRTNVGNEVRIWHLLTHSLDYRFPMSSLKDLPAEEILRRVFEHSFRQAPGSLFCYGNASSLVLGILLERLSGEPLDQQASRDLFAPLKMQRTGWFPLKRHSAEEIVPTEICPWRNKVIRGEVHDESAYALRSHGAVGSAGLFSCVPDLLRFCTMMLNDGRFGDTRVIPQGVLNLATTNRLQHLPGESTALGWELANHRFMGSFTSPRCFGKTGFTGASLVCEPDQGLALVLLSNFTWPQREKSVERIYAVRRTLADAVFGNPQ